MFEQLWGYIKSNLWKIVGIVSVLIIIGTLIYSVLFRSRGTYSTWEEDLVTPDRYLNGQSISDSQKYESQGEQISRACLEQIYHVPFSNVRLADLKNPNTGRDLELDCYNPTLKIAVEYHGINHYRFVPFFHKTVAQYEAMRNRDVYKQQKCIELGITLIIVPYNTTHDNICAFIIRELKRAGKYLIDGW